ncbi:uncharacterized protein LOC115632599 [Scaptodrosophila lebanonensis]|uniref:Uncharacterized protein LOC115632599 n=1 Tax=Drosophila lebanonensis TaxID=7225 RepID=A0A6J2UBD9_DROLE|nr:uncharacterized protein LOC115632599 [Scaptodrosophila lebanonensis]
MHVTSTGMESMEAQSARSYVQQLEQLLAAAEAMAVTVKTTAPITASTSTTLRLTLSTAAPPSTSNVLHTTLRDRLSDSNEIDNSYAAIEADGDDAAAAVDAELVAAGVDYVIAMAQTPTLNEQSGYTAETATARTNTTTVLATQQRQANEKNRDLLSLSLLSASQTSLSSETASTTATTTQAQHEYVASSEKNAISGIPGGASASATFQEIGTQKVNALVPATAATARHGNGAAGSTMMSAPVPATTTTLTTAAAISAGSNKSNVRTSAKKVESKYILPKQQKTDAPMLNYIFDTFSSANKHHHHDQRYGPHFEDAQRIGQPTNMTVQAGSSILLNCRISLLQDKTVSWVRRNAQREENALDLLTVGLHTYTGDKRYKMEFQYPNNWRLKITNVKKDDEAQYECQISTHPPRVIQINLLVNAPKVMIVDEYGDPLQEKYYEIDSTLQLSCVVRNVAMTSSVVYWKHGEDILNYDVTRGGVSVKTELMDDGANSTLFIAKINKADSGNYTCSISDFQNFTIVVHILNGESFAELHHGGATHTTLSNTIALHFLLLLLLLLFNYCSAHTHR